MIFPVTGCGVGWTTGVAVGVASAVGGTAVLVAVGGTAVLVGVGVVVGGTDVFVGVGGNAVLVAVGGIGVGVATRGGVIASVLWSALSISAKASRRSRWPLAS